MVLSLHRAQDVAKPALEVSERLHAVRGGEERIAEVLVHHALSNEVDEGVRLGVEVIAIQQHLGVLEHFPQPPCERPHVTLEHLI